jgi:DNA-binding GntR family transcriptional regulator
MAIAQLAHEPPLIDQVHDRLLAAVVSGDLAPGERLTQERIAEMLGVSRQPVSHALQMLKRRGLFVEAGKRGVVVAPIDGRRLRHLYQVRAALDGLAAELAAERVRSGLIDEAELDAAREALAHGVRLGPGTPMAALIEADVAFHSALYGLSGNSAVAETIAEQWPHFMRSMGLVLSVADRREQVWREHGVILAAVLEGNSAEAGTRAREHTTGAGEETARRLEARS